MTAEEKRAADLVVDTFGLYGGKVLERITHNEKPWRDARKGYGDNIPSNETITKDSILAYYCTVNAEYGLNSEEGINRYIRDMLRKNF